MRCLHENSSRSGRRVSTASDRLRPGVYFLLGRVDVDDVDVDLDDVAANVVADVDDGVAVLDDDSTTSMAVWVSRPCGQ